MYVLALGGIEDYRERRQIVYGNSTGMSLTLLRKVRSRMFWKIYRMLLQFVERAQNYGGHMYPYFVWLLWRCICPREYGANVVLLK
ncbi:hypothetical protein Taro_051716 [Colocasia esculenta]|uniref:Uncharacterized protein n=1 Tax=Colocasia esculenta TaxID=4460 RepID=A0A843XGT3_COLES|nr:hypothetical protein [Colocasia esculenta]